MEIIAQKVQELILQQSYTYKLNQLSYKYFFQMASFEKYQLTQTLGEGTFGKVELASFQGRYYAIKFSTKNSVYSAQVLQNIFEKQASLLSQLQHPHIIKLYEAIKQGVYVRDGKQELRSALVFQYAPHNLGEILELGVLNQTIARTLFQQMINALDYLHSKNIIHRDIKPPNILFDQHFNIKISDFGLSTKITNDSKPKTICGSDSFKSPQLLMKKGYNGVMNDLFAAAVTLFILVSGNAPFITANPNTGFYKFIAMNYIEKFWASHEKMVKFSPELKALLTSMLAFDPTHRLSIAEIISHPWMNGDILMNDDLQNEIKKIVAEKIQKKRKTILKNLQSKPVQMTKQPNRSLSESIDIQKSIEKGKYVQKLGKLSDRFVPILKKYGDLQAFLQFLQGDINMQNGQIQFTKIKSSQSFERLVIEIGIETVDEETDCLKFKLKQGDIFEFVETLKKFDNKLLQE